MSKRRLQESAERKSWKSHVLTLRRSSSFFSSSAFFFLILLILLGSIAVRSTSSTVSPSLVHLEEDQELVISALFLSSVDSDGDGLNDSYEEQLGTNASDYYGDFDQDGLYDFEELLDMYGSGSISSPRFKYNDGTSIGTVLDIYSVHGLDTNKSGYLRDSNFNEDNQGFTDFLLWNVTFDTNFAGGSRHKNVTYSGSTLINVNFSGSDSGGSLDNVLTYNNNNNFTNVIFSGLSAGNGVFGTNYSNNNFTNVIFSGDYSGGVTWGNLTCYNNRFVNVTFSGERSGGASFQYSHEGMIYVNNTLLNVTFSGDYSGGVLSSRSSPGIGFLRYRNNRLTNVIFSGKSSGGNYNGSVTYEGNIMNNVTFSGAHAGGSIDGEVTYFNNSMTGVRFSGYYTGGSENEKAVYRSNNMTSVTFDGISAGVGASANLLFFLLIASSVLVLVLFVSLVSFIYVRRRGRGQASK